MAAKYAYHRYVSTSDEKEAALKFGPTPLASRLLHPRSKGGGEGGKNMAAQICEFLCARCYKFHGIFAHGEKQANSAPGIVVK